MRILNFDRDSDLLVFDLYLNIAVPVSGFSVGGYDPGRLKSEYPQQYTMIKVLLRWPSHESVPDTDRLLQILRKLLFHTVSIASFHRLTEAVHRFAVFTHMLPEHLHDLPGEQITNLSVRNHQSKEIPLRSALLRQISGAEQNTPDIFHRIIQFFVSQFLMNLPDYSLPGNQPLDLVFCRPRIRHVNEMPHDIIAACI